MSQGSLPQATKQDLGCALSNCIYNSRDDEHSSPFAGAASQSGTLCGALFACLDNLLRCTVYVQPRHEEQLLKLAAARRHSLVLRLGAARTSRPKSGLLVIQQELRRVSAVMEIVGTALACAGTRIIFYHGVELFQTLLQDTLALHLGLGSSRLDQPAARQQATGCITPAPSAITLPH